MVKQVTYFEANDGSRHSSHEEAERHEQVQAFRAWARKSLMMTANEADKVVLKFIKAYGVPVPIVKGNEVGGPVTHYAAWPEGIHDLPNNYPYSVPNSVTAATVASSEDGIDSTEAVRAIHYCTVCGQVATSTPSGMVCPMGHGGCTTTDPDEEIPF